MNRRALAALFAAAALMAPALAMAQTSWPTRPLRVIVPYPPGGPSDSSTRIVMERVSSLLGQPIVIDNKGGASGMIGAEAAKSVPPDGYTFLMVTTAMVCITRHLQPIPFDPEKDFVTVGRMATSWGAMAVHPSLPVKNVREFVAYAKANPGKINFGSSGLATITHLIGEMLKLETGIDMVHVPYKGSAPATQALLANQVQVQFDSTVLPHVKAGTLRALAMLGDARWGQLPDLPTLKEQGYEKSDGESWFGIVAPAGTPQPAIGRMAKAMAEAIAAPDIQARLDNAGLRPTWLDPAAFRATITAEARMFGDIIRRGNIKTE
ncbi:tripartite tricarboxylate transporter substrate binding protein [Vineibacter terrae]|uniref:Tripartite tricarboxylate transporter substrate binding protein n=1 Tax=Vineibacter terrae TaxID=2586908 RepID=A0A5C8PJP4_9HYPH|nr:tripartite tricarboxylate transporter substrate binding protein [Vineibacter terrae]TXL73850.1 tripartite tricarboxylate transporter substrate binding protein [Vineibacter terrae]